MTILEIIEAKKRGAELTRDQIAGLVEGFTADEVPAYQMAAFLMAVWFRGMTGEETAALTGVMLGSGEELDTSGLGGPSADKHSTGGVGDKVSLLLAPLAAACGLKAIGIESNPDYYLMALKAIPRLAALEIDGRNGIGPLL